MKQGYIDLNKILTSQREREKKMSNITKSQVEVIAKLVESGAEDAALELIQHLTNKTSTFFPDVGTLLQVVKGSRIISIRTGALLKITAELAPYLYEVRIIDNGGKFEGKKTNFKLMRTSKNLVLQGRNRKGLLDKIIVEPRVGVNDEYDY